MGARRRRRTDEAELRRLIAEKLRDRRARSRGLSLTCKEAEAILGVYAGNWEAANHPAVAPVFARWRRALEASKEPK